MGEGGLKKDQEDLLRRCGGKSLTGSSPKRFFLGPQDHRTSSAH